MERQRQRRLARLSSGGGNGVVGVDSPTHSTASSHVSEEQYSLLGKQSRVMMMNNQQMQAARRRNAEDGTDSLLLDINDARTRPRMTNI
jgi:hypothetical protein